MRYFFFVLCVVEEIEILCVVEEIEDHSRGFPPRDSSKLVLKKHLTDPWMAVLGGPISWLSILGQHSFTHTVGFDEYNVSFDWDLWL